MRILIEKAINETDRSMLPNDSTPPALLINETNPTILKIVNTLKEHFDFEIKQKSYWRVEKLPTGHGWHVDTGSENHMSWCQVGCSILLTSNQEFRGGETFYNQENPILTKRDKYDIVAHSSDEWHMVEPHTGNRIVLLLFI
jgi:hypothetical protein